jgi:hypothetical protein
MTDLKIVEISRKFRSRYGRRTNCQLVISPIDSGGRNRNPFGSAPVVRAFSPPTILPGKVTYGRFVEENSGRFGAVSLQSEIIVSGRTIIIESYEIALSVKGRPLSAPEVFVTEMIGSIVRKDSTGTRTWRIVVLCLTVLLNDSWPIDKVDLVVGHDVVDVVGIGLEAQARSAEESKQYTDCHGWSFHGWWKC